MLKSLFGKKTSKSKQTSPEKNKLPDAIRNLQETEDLLLKKQSHLENKIKKELTIAKENAQKNKKLALAALKRKKRVEQQLEILQGTLATLDQQKLTLDNANINSLVLSTMDKSSKALKDAHKNVSVEKVDDLLDELDDHKKETEDIAMALSDGQRFEQDFDEDALAKELEELELSALEDDSDLANLPNVPQKDIQQPTVDKTKTQPKVPLMS